MKVQVTHNRSEILILDQTAFDTFERRVVRADFHCVTGWSVQALEWTGISLADVLASAGLTDRPNDYVVARSRDRRSGHFVWADATQADVLLATHLDGQPLGRRHGGPVRLVAPKHYGYKSIKALERIDVRSVRPDQLGKEHLRGRVDHEERHPKLPSWVVRRPYRVAAPLAAALAERSLNSGPLE